MESDNDKRKWLNVATTSMPRLLTEQCIGSFLDCMEDRDEYRLKWLCHLDQYPGLEDNFEESLGQIHRIAERFDDAVIMQAETNQGFGRSAHRLFTRIEYDTFWIEDDWEWVKPFRIADVEVACLDCFSFQPASKPTAAGAMHPTFWRKYVVDFVVEHYPKNFDDIHETTIVNICTKLGKFQIGQGGNVPENACVHGIGDKMLRDAGLTHNHCGQRLGGEGHRRHRPAKKDGAWVQQ